MISKENQLKAFASEQNITIECAAKFQSETLHSTLEAKSWAPWLQFTEEEIAAHSKVFSAGQLVATNDLGEPIACLTTNRIFWNSDPSTLPTWDEVAGQDRSLEDTYEHGGNTLCLLSMSVEPKYRKFGLAEKLTKAAIQLGNKIGVEKIIGPFRPSGYGEYKINCIKNNVVPLEFGEYCGTRRADGRLLDPWLRRLDTFGMVPIKIEPSAMKVQVDADEFKKYKVEYRSSDWLECFNAESGLIQYECGETGTWTLNNDQTALYIEANLWGQLPLTNPAEQELQKYS